jgi:serine/threonine protein kinase/tetratricopeptide (TPR) repeat protein
MTLTAGSRLGRYAIVSPLGEGGMGRVYLAQDPALGRRLAIKLLPPEYRTDTHRRDRLLQEARAASALNHPNIIVVHDVGESEGTVFVAMEYVEGATLRAWAKEAPRGSAEVLDLIRQAAGALEAAHRAGLVHRDLKPENIMVRPDGMIKVLDFGLARRIAPTDLSSTQTLEGLVAGTPRYMAPEQILGQPAQPASDLFSLGVVLYELLTRVHPFAAESWADSMHKILHETPPPASQCDSSLGAEFDFVLSKAMAKEPSRRYPSAADFENDLAMLASRSRQATDPVPSLGSRTRTLAVLPFKNIGGNPELRYLSLGLADAVITQLASVPDLIVRATNAVASYEDKPVDPRRAGEELAAEAVLDASFQLVSGRLRATARLVEVVTGRMLWAGKVDVRSNDVFELQDRVAQGIAEALPGPRASVPDAAGVPAGARFTPGPQAYEHYLRGMDAYRKFDRDRNFEAIRHLEEAVRLEPGFARAWAMLGEARQWVASMGWDPDSVWFARAEEALARATEIDPDDGFVHYLAATLHIAHGRKREAYADLVIAHAAMPHVAHVYHYFAYLFRLADLLDQAIDAEERCWQIEPNDLLAYTGMIRMLPLRGEIQRAQEWVERGRLRFGSPPGLEASEMVFLCLSGRFRELVERFGAGDLQAHALGIGSLCLALLHLGEEERARRLFGQFGNHAAVDMDAAAWAAAVMARLGDTDRAFQHLARATALGLDSATLYEHPVLFEPLHGDPRWRPFIDGVRTRVATYRRELRWPIGGVA